MFIEHVNIPKGVVFGATTTITSIILDPQNNVTSIEVQLTSNSTKMILKNHSFQHKYTYDGYFYKASFLIVLAYAMTSHKSQGATIATKIIMDIKKYFTQLGLTYVMFSIVTNQNKLKKLEILFQMILLAIS
jgi:ATP-dependent DNA helicase PIF1